MRFSAIRKYTYVNDVYVRIFILYTAVFGYDSRYMVSSV